MSDIHDYLIDQVGKDWAALLRDWLPIFPSGFTIWMVNRLGDIIAVFEDESVHFLDVGNCNLRRIANDREDFIVRIDEDDNASDWLAMRLVDHCVAAGMTLAEDQCYGFKIPPMLGGGYSFENVVPTGLSAHYSLLADLWQQTKDLPDGTEITVQVVD
jgi:hypothetical protein